LISIKRADGRVASTLFQHRVCLIAPRQNARTVAQHLSRPEQLRELETGAKPLRHIGVNRTVKLAECKSLDTDLPQQGATVVSQFAHLP
jgi:hypothetical protein